MERESYGQEINANTEKDKTAEEIRSILDKSASCINTGMAPETGSYQGYTEFNQPGQAKADKYYGFYKDLEKIVKNDQILDKTERRLIGYEIFASASKPGLRESSFILPSQDPEKKQFAYLAKGVHEWKDASGRGGQKLFIFVDIPDSEVEKLTEMIKKDPLVLREIAEQVVLERIGVDQETWEHGSKRTDGNPLRPPYEIWDSKVENPSILVYSAVETVDLPRISRSEIKK